jgi:hypothetical protein
LAKRLATPPAIRTLQRKLYVKAKTEPTFRFYRLYDKVYRPDILAHAFALAKANDGAPGVDGMTFDDVDAAGRENWLAALREDLRTRRYRPAAVRRVYIPKPGGGERPFGIPTVRDRVVQTAADLVLRPVFEADFDDAMYGYRPRRSAQQAVTALHRVLQAGYTDVVDADLSKVLRYDSACGLAQIGGAARQRRGGTPSAPALAQRVQRRARPERARATNGEPRPRDASRGRHLPAVGQHLHAPVSPHMAGAGHGAAPAGQVRLLRG